MSTVIKCTRCRRRHRGQEKYAEAIEIEYKTLCNYRSISRAFSLSREKAPWSVYAMLAGREDRYEILAEQDKWTVAQMRARLDKRQNYYSQDDPTETARRARDLPAEEQANLVREALSNPEVVERGSATDFEITRGCGLLDSSTRPRRGELVTQTFLEDSGKTREHQGSQWTVWTPTADALAWYRRTQLGGAA